MYEQQHPFKLNDFVTMSSFLNTFLYKAVSGNLFGKRRVFKLILQANFEKYFYFRLENGTIQRTFPLVTHLVDGIVQTRLSQNVHASRTLADKGNTCFCFHDGSGKRT